MCFSNLPVEFDADGNPTLAEEADDVDHPDCGCGADADAEIALEETDPRAAYDDIVETMPESVRTHLEGAGGPERETAGERERTEAEGD